MEENGSIREQIAVKNNWAQSQEVKKGWVKYLMGSFTISTPHRILTLTN
jgi:hypothetical protein